MPPFLQGLRRQGDVAARGQLYDNGEERTFKNARFKTHIEDYTGIE